MSFSYDTKNELCRLPVQKLCCARAEAYGILLFCNTFSATEVRIITENPHFAARLPKLFRRAFNLQFDRQPEPEQEEGKRIFQITDQKSWTISSICWGLIPRCPPSWKRTCATALTAASTATAPIWTRRWRRPRSRWRPSAACKRRSSGAAAGQASGNGGVAAGIPGVESVRAGGGV